MVRHSKMSPANGSHFDDVLSRSGLRNDPAHERSLYTDTCDFIPQSQICKPRGADGDSIASDDTIADSLEVTVPKGLLHSLTQRHEDTLQRLRKTKGDLKKAKGNLKKVERDLEESKQELHRLLKTTHTRFDGHQQPYEQTSRRPLLQFNDANESARLAIAATPTQSDTGGKASLKRACDDIEDPNDERIPDPQAIDHPLIASNAATRLRKHGSRGPGPSEAKKVRFEEVALKLDPALECHR